MVESLEFLLSLVMCCVFIGVPVAAAGAVCHHFGKGQNKSL